MGLAPALCKAVQALLARLQEQVAAASTADPLGGMPLPARCHGLLQLVFEAAWQVRRQKEVLPLSAVSAAGAPACLCPHTIWRSEHPSQTTHPPAVCDCRCHCTAAGPQAGCCAAAHVWRPGQLLDDVPRAGAAAGAAASGGGAAGRHACGQLGCLSAGRPAEPGGGLLYLGRSLQCMTPGCLLRAWGCQILQALGCRQAKALHHCITAAACQVYLPARLPRLARSWRRAMRRCCTRLRPCWTCWRQTRCLPTLPRPPVR